MRRQQPLPRRVLRFIRENDLFRANEPLLVGVSGGPDSVCLIHTLSGLKLTLDTELHIVHLNHMLRGAESDADAEYVYSLARELGIPATIENRDVKAYQRQNRLSLEKAAREVRYTFFAEVARTMGVETVAVGHTADDQIETILMHLVRGTGLSGLRGMQPLNIWRLPEGARLRIARPLLEIRRDETEDYCHAEGLSPRSDSSNRLPNQLRNKVRSRLIPLLREYNPDIETSLLRTASAADADMSYIDEQVSRLCGHVIEERPDGIAIRKEEFSPLYPALKRHIVRSALQQLLGDLQDIESIHIESLLEAMTKPAGKRLSLPRGLTFHSDYSHGLITARGETGCPYPPLDGEYRLNVPGETELGGWRVRSIILEQRPMDADETKWRACFDFDTTGDKLTVRSRKQGDRFQPLGMEYPKKLQDFMVDSKIPRHWRDGVPLVCSPQQIIWVAGWRIDHRAMVTQSTERVLCIEFEIIKET